MDENAINDGGAGRMDSVDVPTVTVGRANFQLFGQLNDPIPFALAATVLDDRLDFHRIVSAATGHVFWGQWRASGFYAIEE